MKPSFTNTRLIWTLLVIISGSLLCPAKYGHHVNTDTFYGGHFRVRIAGFDCSSKIVLITFLIHFDQF